MWHVDMRVRGSVQRVMLHVSYHANHGDPWAEQQTKALPDGIFLRPVLMCHGFADDRYWDRLRLIKVCPIWLLLKPADDGNGNSGVVGGEKPPSPQRNSERMEIVVCDHAKGSIESAAWRRRRTPFNGKRHPVIGSLQGKIGGGTY